MANNVFTGPNAIVAKNTVDFVTAGLTALNTAKIFLVDATLKSYVPGRSINGISGFVAGKGYYLQALQDMDISANVAPPLAGLTQLATPGSFTVTPGNAQNVLDWADVTNATSYTVDRATNSGFTTGVALNIYTGATSGFTDTGRTNGTLYYYRVRATATGYTDSAYATGSGSPTAVVLEDLNFATQTNLASASNIWQGTTGTWENHGLANKKIAAGQNGYVQYRYTNADQKSAILGFNTVSEDAPYDNFEAAFYINALANSGAGGFNVIESGSVSFATGSTLTLNNYYRLERTGSAIALKESADGTTFTTVYTFTFSSAADLFIVCAINFADSGHLRLPKGFNLS